LGRIGQIVPNDEVFVHVEPNRIGTVKAVKEV
jgi:hypothetical protein